MIDSKLTSGRCNSEILHNQIELLYSLHSFDFVVGCCKLGLFH